MSLYFCVLIRFLADFWFKTKFKTKDILTSVFFSTVVVCCLVTIVMIIF